ncbi:hypothetical protein BGW39_007903 [Mortierella sp. 14UC]|nr:hypothetical protein BGW39_007903 [Mortierella sp. 14UC]
MTVIYKFVLLASVALAVAAAPIKTPTPIRHSTAVSLDIANNFAEASSFASKSFVARRADDNESDDSSSTGNDSPSSNGDDDSSSDDKSNGDKSNGGKSNGDKSTGNDSGNGSTPTPTTSNDSTPSPTSPSKGSDATPSPSKSDKVSSSGGSFSGKGTWFTDTTGSCEVSFNTNDMIVAMNEAQMGGKSQCGKSVKISYGGKTATAKVVDTCPSQFCSSGSLDLSQAVFKKLAPLDVGVIDIKWEFA